MGTQDSLEKSVADGRLYLADYSVFDGALNGSFPAAQKFNYAPLALFAVPPGGQSLVPVAIQCAPQPGPDNPIFLPRDGDSWLIAKTIVQIADANFHEVVSHLGRTHLFIEPFIIATHNQLSPTHPLFVLLTPHFEGTLAINDAASRKLIVSRSLVDAIVGKFGRPSASVCRESRAELSAECQHLDAATDRWLGAEWTTRAVCRITLIATMRC